MSAPAPVHRPQMTQFYFPTDQLQETKSYLQVFLDFMKEGGKNFAKSIGYTAGWANMLIPDMPEGVANLSRFMGDVKNFFSFTELPEKTLKFRDAVAVLFSGANPIPGEPAEWTYLIAHRTRNVIKELSTLINTSCDTISLSSRFIPISAETMRTVGGVNLASTLVGAGNGSVENIQKLSNLKVEDADRRTFAWINLARDVSYLALAIFGLASFVLGAAAVGVAASPAMMLAYLTSGLSFTIAGFFYERIVDPEMKGANIATRTIDNVKRQIALAR